MARIVNKLRIGQQGVGCQGLSSKARFGLQERVGREGELVRQGKG